MQGLIPVLSLIVGLSLFNAGCATTGSAGDVEALHTLQKQVDAAIIGGDTDRYLSMLSDDAVLMPPDGPPIVGKAQIRAWSKEMSKRLRIQTYAPVDEEVVVAGDWAFRRSGFVWTAVLDGQPINDSGKFIIIYKRENDGAWRVARDIWNGNGRPH